jgi:alpha-glucosidase (family GH31 glycosyl hydrolase)
VWASVAQISAKTLSVRYSLLLHVYNTLFFQVHMAGGVVMRPLFFNFAHHPATFAIQAQFMLGSVLLFTPVLTQGAMSVWGYFPPTTDAGQPAR